MDSKELSDLSAFEDLLRDALIDAGVSCFAIGYIVNELSYIGTPIGNLQGKMLDHWFVWSRTTQGSGFWFNVFQILFFKDFYIEDVDLFKSNRRKPK
jgi:hypothetical protein